MIGMNRRWLIVGDSGMGKSTTAREVAALYVPRKRKVLVLSMFPDWGAWIRTWRGVWIRATRESVGRLDWEAVLSFRRAFVEFVGWAQEDVREALDALALRVWKGDVDYGLIVLDEAHLFLPLHGASREFERLILGIRHRHGDLMFISQAPQRLSMPAREQANAIVAHRLSSEVAMEHLFRVAPELEAYRHDLQRLDVGERFLVDVERKETWFIPRHGRPQRVGVSIGGEGWRSTSTAHT
jgi:energy-coupling factor transporter ATP-binding protein EcfA2